MSKLPEILVTVGSLKGQRFTVTEVGLRLGRSSSCEIAISDPALSRNHCLFELREGSLWVTDLASANGTFVDGEQLGADSRLLKVGDVVTAGESCLEIVAAGEIPPPSKKSLAPTTLDLGLGNEPVDADAENGAERMSPRRLLLWVAAVVAVAGAAFLILSGGPATPEAAPKALPKQEKAVLHALTFEKVEADQTGI